MDECSVLILQYMSRVRGQIGRPKNDSKQLSFKEKSMENAQRIELECLVLKQVYQVFFNEQKQQRASKQEFKKMLETHGCGHIYSKLFQRDYDQQELTEQENKDFTSSKDVRFMIHYLVRDWKKALTPKQILMAMACFFMKLRMMNVYFLQFFNDQSNICMFQRIIFNGPQNSNHQLIEVLNNLAHFSLSLLTLQKIKVLKKSTSMQVELLSSISSNDLSQDVDSSFNS